MEIRLLGPVEVHDENGPVHIGSPKIRAVLAVLALESGRPVSVEKLIDRVWGNVPPPKARQTLQSYVTGLRKWFGAGLPPYHAGGYVLDVPRDWVDLYRFQDLVGQARVAARRGEDMRASGLLTQALDLWRGEPLGGLEGYDWVPAVRTWLAEERLAALEERLELDLRQGRHAEVVGELTDLVEAHPWRPRLASQLMLALYRSQRQRDALAVYQELLHRLREDGLRPAAALRELESRIQREDPALAVPAATAYTAEPHGAEPDGATLGGAGPGAAGRAVPVGAGIGDRARNDFIEEVRRRWIREGLERLPAYARRLEISLAEQPDAVPDSYRPGREGSLALARPLPAGTRLIDLFEPVYNRRCLVLGAAGAGKTTSLLQLADDLLDAAGRGGTAGLPAVLLLSRWAPRPGGFTAWVLDELGEHYGVPPDRARSVLAAGELALLLDGLDEVPAEQRRTCAQAINAFRRSSPCGLLVTCRAPEYADLGIQLELGGAVVLQPLTRGQVDDQLAYGGTAQCGLRGAVTHDPVLAELLSNPLMLGVAMLGYGEGGLPTDGSVLAAGPAPAGDGDLEQHRRALFDGYLRAALYRDRDMRAARSGAAQARAAFSSEQCYRGLVWLARLMTIRNETVLHPDWFGPGWLPDSAAAWSPSSRLARLVTGMFGLRRIAVALTYGVVAGAILGLTYGLQAWRGGQRGVPDTGFDVPPAFAVLVGVAVWLCVVLTFLLSGTGRARSSWRASLVRAAVYIPVFVGVGGLHRGVVLWLRDGWRSGVAGGLTGGLVYGLSSAGSISLALCLAGWLVRTGTAGGDAPRRWPWRRVVLSMDCAVAIAATIGVCHALAHLSPGSPASGYTILGGLGYGLVIGIGGGSVIGAAFGLVDIETDRPAARWRWSVRRLGRVLLAALGYGGVHVLVFLFIPRALLGPDKGPVFGLLIAVTFWLTFGLGYCLAPDRSAPPAAPARALAASLRAVVAPSLVAGGAALLAVPALGAEVTGYADIILIVPAVLAALLTVWYTGGGVWLGHHVTRWTTWAAGLLPRDLLGFLAYADERMLLLRLGGGYQFRHGAIQKYLAARDPQVPPAPLR